MSRTRSSKNRPADKKVPKPRESEPKRVKTFELRLNAEELLHLRDVLSVILPPDGSVRLSEALALQERRQMTESKLWGKVVNLCMDAKLPVGEEAPDFFVGMSGPLVLSIFQLDKGQNASAEGDGDGED